MAHAQSPEGEIASITGQGEYRHGQQGAWTPAAVKQKLFPLDWLQTLDLSRMVIRFGDGSTEFIGPNSQFHVVKVATPADPKTILELNKGRMWSQSKTSPGGLEIRTGTALAAMRGTDWELVMDGEVTVLSVFSGEVEFSNEQGGVTVRPNEQARAEKGKAPVKLLLRTLARAHPVGECLHGGSAPLRRTRSALRRDRLAGPRRPARRGVCERPCPRRRERCARRRLPAAADFEVYRGEFAAARAALERGARRFSQDARFEVAAGAARAVRWRRREGAHPCRRPRSRKTPILPMRW